MKRQTIIEVVTLFLIAFFPHASFSETPGSSGSAYLPTREETKTIYAVEKRGDLTLQEKIEVFRGLGDSDLLNEFRKLSEADKTAVLENLEAQQRMRIIGGLGEEERKVWFGRYPELQGPPDLPKETGPPEPAVRSRSTIEKILSGQFPTDVYRDLTQFGYDFFDKDISTFSPVMNIPVGDDYPIGPGDGFTIHLWGKAEKTFEVSVDRDGRIFVPPVGTLDVSGLRLEELKRFLYGKFREYYPDFEMSVTMGRLRTIDVFIVGEARYPGKYSVSSLSTAISALYAAGGPSKNGSLRGVKVFRNGKTVSILDLYQFFINGLKRDDIRLQSGDTILIPVIGPTAGMAGNIRRPGIYEMKGTQSIGDLIELAGGLLPTGHLQNVVIERIEGHRRRVIRSFNLESSHDGADENLKHPLADFDVIKIFPVHQRLRQMVSLEGHVKYPSEHELRPGMRLRDIIPSFDQLLPAPYLPRAEIVRLVPPDLRPEIVEFNLGDLLTGDENQNLPLQDLDRVIVYDSLEKEEVPKVTIKGAVRNPGTFTLLKGMRVKDLVFQAGNFTKKAYLEKAGLTRVLPLKTGTDIVKIEFCPERAMKAIPEDNILLKNDDRLYIREVPRYSQALQRTVLLEGEFVFPGEYAFAEGERLSSVIERAGGFSEEAYLFGAVFRRESARKVQQERIEEYVAKLEQDLLTLSAFPPEMLQDKNQSVVYQETLAAKKELLQKLKRAETTGRMVIDIEEVAAMPSSPYNFELRPGDHLIMTAKPDFVNILGEIYNPTAVLAEKGKTIGYYLSRVGGTTKDAEEDQIYVVKANGSVVSRSQSGFFGMASWDTNAKRWTMGGFDSIVLDPGDTIIVPKKLARYPWMGTFKDLTQILYQIAVGAGVIIAAF